MTQADGHVEPACEEGKAKGEVRVKTKEGEERKIDEIPVEEVEEVVTVLHGIEQQAPGLVLQAAGPDPRQWDTTLQVISWAPPGWAAQCRAQ